MKWNWDMCTTPSKTAEQSMIMVQTLQLAWSETGICAQPLQYHTNAVVQSMMVHTLQLARSETGGICAQPPSGPITYCCIVYDDGSDIAASIEWDWDLHSTPSRPAHILQYSPGKVSRLFAKWTHFVTGVSLFLTCFRSSILQYLYTLNI